MRKSRLRETLKEQGYKYTFMLNSNKNEFYATKEDKLSNGDFDDNSLWDCYTLEPGESWFKLNCKTPYGVIHRV